MIEIDKGGKDLPDTTCFISAVTVYEFIRGKVDPLRAKALLEEVCIVLPIDNRVIGKASEVWRELRARGEVMDDRDLLIGVTAIVNDLPLWTGNRKHFDRLERYGLRFWTVKDT